MCEFVVGDRVDANIQVLTVIKDRDSLLLRDSGLFLLPGLMNQSAVLEGSTGQGTKQSLRPTGRGSDKALRPSVHEEVDPSNSTRKLGGESFPHGFWEAVPQPQLEV